MPATVTTPRQPLEVPAQDATGPSQGPVRVPPPWRRDRVPRLAAAVAVLAGLVNLVSALLPAERDRMRLLADFVPGAVSRGATVAVAAAGVGLLLLAGGLRRRHRLAWLAAVGLLAGSAALHVVKGLDVEEALTEAFLAGLLAGQAGCFPARAALGEHRAVLGPALTVAAATLAYGMLGLVANDHDVRADLGLGGVVVEVGRMALGLGAGVELAGRFGRLFPGSLAAVFWVGVLLVAARALAPALAGRTTDPDLAEAVTTSGDSLAYFALRDDRAVVRAGDALIAYGTVGPVALAAGDPLGPPGQWPGAIAAFCGAAAIQGRVAGVLGCGAAAAAAWRDAGLTTIYLGDEAVLDLDRFTLEGRGMRIARQSWNRARRAGFTSLVCRSGELAPAQVAVLAEVAWRWRAGTAERGFSMALGRLFDPRDPDTLVVAARDPAGRLRGFLHLVPWGSDGASLDVMRRDRQAPSWLNDFLVVEAARRLPELGIRRVSLNFSVLRAVLAAGAGPGVPARLRVAGWLLRRLSGPFQIQTLYRFNRKFCPGWQPRYLAVEAPEALPRVALAVLRAEGLLCPPWRLRPSSPARTGSR
ncbi:MAG TPA: phosphatidylglycerol lysyltransferase domain-containing protein [Actinomycetes bacterium]|nr:phosphatidylglycerol lysyltransferase domain-containing protein [Actinomycetes bacterium]